MVTVCPPQSPQPSEDPTSPSYWTTDKWGQHLRRKGGQTPSGVAQWCPPCYLFQGKSLFDMRKAWLSHIAWQWRTSTNFDRAQFAGMTSGWAFTHINGTLKSSTAYATFIHWAGSAFGPSVMENAYRGDHTLRSPNWTPDSGFSEPAPPAITAASWDGAGNGSITLSNYNNFDVYQLSIFATIPGCLSLTHPRLVTLASYTTIGSSSYSFPFGADMTPPPLIKPWPSGSTCLLGLRVWLQESVYEPPSPIAAVQITIP